MKINPKFLIALAVIVVIFMAGVFIILPRLQPHTFHGMVLQPSDPVDFTLTAHTGEQKSISDYRGKHVVLYFGYTFCPDVCPLTMADLGQAVRLLEDKGDDVQVIMVTVDPERDDVQRMAQYATAFHPSFVGMTGTTDEVAEAALPLGIFYERNEVEGASGYLMDHTASMTMLDDEGRVRLVWPFGTSAEYIAEDLDYFMR